MNLVIGAHGFLGRHLTRKLSGSGKVVAVARSGTPDVMADLRSSADLEYLADMASGQTVYYCANFGGRAVAQHDPAMAYRVNAIAPARLAQSAKRFVYFSTDYVFSQPGIAADTTATSPDSVYAESKVQGEHSVLAACVDSLIVRTSGLFSEEGQSLKPFSELDHVEAEDNWLTAPTYIPDLVDAVTYGPLNSARGIRHMAGPQALSRYEFHQLASLRWGYEVSPTLAPTSRHTTFVSSKHLAARNPADVFASHTGQSAPSAERVTVLDCIGVVLSGRRWRETDPSFWADQGHGPEEPLQRMGVDRIVGAYCPNPALWRLLRRRRPGQHLILANNGPWQSFSLWNTKYGFDSIFDEVINSERDGLTKPDAAFRSFIDTRAAGRPVSLIDDRQDIVEAARSWGWESLLSRATADWPIERFEIEGAASA